jgi:hypothetical protein
MWLKLTRSQAGLISSLKHKLFVKPFEEWMSQVTPSSEGPRLMAFSQRTPDSRKI